MLKLTAKAIGSGSIELVWEKTDLPIFLSYRTQESSTWELLEITNEEVLTFVDLPTGASYEFQLLSMGRAISGIAVATVDDNDRYD
jgi:hypothetical protein